MGVSMLEGYALASASASSQLTSFGLGSVGESPGSAFEHQQARPP